MAWYGDIVAVVMRVETFTKKQLLETLRKIHDRSSDDSIKRDCISCAMDIKNGDFAGINDNYSRLLDHAELDGTMLTQVGRFVFDTEKYYFNEMDGLFNNETTNA